MSDPLKRWLTAAVFQSLGISDDTRERLNRLSKILEREGPDYLAHLICRGPDFAALSEHQLSGFGRRRNGEGFGGLLWRVLGY